MRSMPYVFSCFVTLYSRSNVYFKHTQRLKAFSASNVCLSKSLAVATGQAMHGGNRQARQHKGRTLHIKFISGHAQPRSLHSHNKHTRLSGCTKATFSALAQSRRALTANRMSLPSTPIRSSLWPSSTFQPTSGRELWATVRTERLSFSRAWGVEVYGLPSPAASCLLKSYRNAHACREL
jgi:hypothetical protein